MAKKEKEIKEKKQEQTKQEPKKKEVLQDGNKKEVDKKQPKKEQKGPKEGKKETLKTKEEQKQVDEIKHIVRITNTDLVGKKSVQYALTDIKGIGKRLAKIISVDSGLDPEATLGYMTDSDINKLQSSVDNITSVIPYWMANRQNDFMTGDDRHVIGTDVILGVNENINFMKKMRSYKGLRHERGLRVRGQRTRSTGRRGRTVGVTRATLTASKAAAKEGEKKEEKKGGAK